MFSFLSSSAHRFIIRPLRQQCVLTWWNLSDALIYGPDSDRAACVRKRRTLSTIQETCRRCQPQWGWGGERLVCVCSCGSSGYLMQPRTEQPPVMFQPVFSQVAVERPLSPLKRQLRMGCFKIKAERLHTFNELYRKQKVSKWNI